jgi:hypothetical protein
VVEGIGIKPEVGWLLGSGQDSGVPGEERALNSLLLTSRRAPRTCARGRGRAPRTRTQDRGAVTRWETRREFA